MSNSLSSLLSLNVVTIQTIAKIINETNTVLIRTINNTTHQGIMQVMLLVSRTLNRL